MSVPSTKTKQMGFQSSNISKEEMNQALERVLSSKYFAHAPMKQRFLRLICEFHLNGRGSELNEYLIGREVFDRDNSYNPATDPIVRVGAHGIREKLERYYQKDGAADEVQIEIPVGSYEPCFVRVSQTNQVTSGTFESSQPSPPEATHSPLIPPTSSWRHWPYVIVSGLLITVALLIYSNLGLREQIGQNAKQNSEDVELYTPVWQTFLQSPDPTMVVLSNPPVFRFVNPADPAQVLRKSVQVSPDELDPLYGDIINKSIINIISNSRLTMTTDTYTGIGEAIGLFRITDLFRSLDKSLTLKQSRTVSAEDLKSHNVIALGSIWVNNWSSKLPAKEDFVYTNQVTVKNQNPLPGESVEYKASFDPQSGKLTEDYALITVCSNISNRDVVMVLAGLHSEGTAAAAEFVTSKQYLAQLNQRLVQSGANGKLPRFYQALLKVSVENGIPTFITLVAVHELSPTPR